MPDKDLCRFDDIVTRLNEFEDLRYPDEILKFGAHITIGLVTQPLIGAPAPAVIEPRYSLSVTDLDALVDRLLKLFGINPESYLGAYNNAVQFVEMHNVTCQGWFPQLEKNRQT